MFVTTKRVKKKFLPLLCSGIAIVGIFQNSPARAIDETLNTDDPVLLWNSATLKAIGNTTLGPTPSSRALSMVHTSIYDAWAAYDPVAINTLGDTLKVSDDKIKDSIKCSISYAAYTTLVDLFPTQKPIFNDLMNKLGYDRTITSPDTNTAAGIGNFVAQKLLDFRHQDGSNQLNNYADTSGYQPVNTWDNIVDPNHWQPLSVDNGTHVQKFLTPQWGNVTPFALTSSDQFLPPPPAQFGTQKYIDQALQIIKYNAELTDEQKTIAEYWADGPQTVLPPGHWNLFGEYVSVRDKLSLDDNVKLFFTLDNAVFDAGIAVWDTKVHYDSPRPITAIRYLAEHNLLPDDNPYVRTNPETGVQEIYAWAGPNQGSQWIDGSTWIPYQISSSITPPFAEYVSGHSAYSAASAEILQRFTGSDRRSACHTQPANSSTFESQTPAVEVKLCWDTFSEAADQAGISRRYGGIHFEDGDLEGRALGREVGAVVWDKAQYYINGGFQAKSVPESTPLLGLLAFATLGAPLMVRYNRLKGRTKCGN